MSSFVSVEICTLPKKKLYCYNGDKIINICFFSLMIISIWIYINITFENLVLYFLYLEVLLYFRINTYTSMTKIYYLMRITQIILDIGFYQWSRICRIIVDETQKEWRLNWTFVDKFFVGIFLKKIWWIGWKIDGCNSPNLGGLCAISALKLFFKWMDLKQVSTFLMIRKTGYFSFYYLQIIEIWFMKI